MKDRNYVWLWFLLCGPFGVIPWFIHSHVKRKAAQREYPFKRPTKKSL